MNNIIVERKASTSQAAPLVGCLFRLFHRLDLTPIPPKPKSKVPLVQWSDDGWKPTPAELEAWASKPGINCGVRCGQNLAVIDCDSEDAYFGFITTHELPPDCPIVKPGRGYHIWVKPKKPIRSQRVGSIEIKCFGSYVVAPPSTHPCGVPYVFQVPPNGVLPEVDLEALFNLPSDSAGVSGKSPTNLDSPSDFALRYGKSPYGQTLCGLATKIMTRPDGQVKKLLSLRCWKWHCPKCAPLLESHWLNKMSGLPFRLILRMPTMGKPPSRSLWLKTGQALRVGGRLVGVVIDLLKIRGTSLVQLSFKYCSNPCSNASSNSSPDVRHFVQMSANCQSINRM